VATFASDCSHIIEYGPDPFFVLFCAAHVTVPYGHG
jgi:hypothetical protein